MLISLENSSFRKIIEEIPSKSIETHDYARGSLARHVHLKILSIDHQVPKITIFHQSNVLSNMPSLFVFVLFFFFYTWLVSDSHSDRIDSNIAHRRITSTFVFPINWLLSSFFAINLIAEAKFLALLLFSSFVFGEAERCWHFIKKNFRNAANEHWHCC